MSPADSFSNLLFSSFLVNGSSCSATLNTIPEEYLIAFQGMVFRFFPRINWRSVEFLHADKWNGACDSNLFHLAVPNQSS